jgi:hypothetical protein
MGVIAYFSSYLETSNGYWFTYLNTQLMAKVSIPRIGYDQPSLNAPATMDGLISPAASIASNACEYCTNSPINPKAAAAKPKGIRDRKGIDSPGFNR